MFMPPGPDTTALPLSALVDQMLSIIGADGVKSPDELREVQRLMIGLQSIGEQRIMGQPQAAPIDDTPIDAYADGTEDANPLPDGVEYAGSGY